MFRMNQRLVTARDGPGSAPASAQGTWAEQQLRLLEQQLVCLQASSARDCLQEVLQRREMDGLFHTRTYLIESVWHGVTRKHVYKD